MAALLEDFHLYAADLLAADGLVQSSAEKYGRKRRRPTVHVRLGFQRSTCRFRTVETNEFRTRIMPSKRPAVRRLSRTRVLQVDIVGHDFEQPFGQTVEFEGRRKDLLESLEGGHAISMQKSR